MTQPRFSRNNLSVGLIPKIGVVIWIFLTYIVALTFQLFKTMSLYQCLILTLLILIFILIFWFNRMFKAKFTWIYYIIQGSLIFATVTIVPLSFFIILIGLLPIIVAQSITTFKNKLGVVIVFISTYGLSCLVIGYKYGWDKLPIFVLVLLFNLTIVNVYSVILSRQVNAGLRMEYYLKELEIAHQKVEELTLSNERQRMARDLHDTLAQGLAGLIMQLEAVDAHMLNGNIDRSKEILQQSMKRARETLRDARTAIDNLRSKSIEEKDFIRELLITITNFSELSSINVETDIDAIPKLSILIMEHSLFIISECFQNILKHANASRVALTVKCQNEKLLINIEDDGIGFKTNLIGKDLGKYGLVGLIERVRLIQGDIKITSRPGLGTHVMITIPI